jgi:hypothetical protein
MSIRTAAVPQPRRDAVAAAAGITVTVAAAASTSGGSCSGNRAGVRGVHAVGELIR